MPDPFGTRTSSRIAAFAKLGDDGSLATFALPRLDPTGQGVFSNSGLWWYSLQPGGELFGYEVFYAADLQAKGSNAQVVRVSDIQNNKGVVAVDPQNSRVIIAVTEGQQREGNRETYLYLADATGKVDRLVHKADGDVVQASVSADGRETPVYNPGSLGRHHIEDRLGSAPRRGPLGIKSHWPRQLQRMWSTAKEVNVHLTASFLPADRPVPGDRG